MLVEGVVRKTTLSFFVFLFCLSLYMSPAYQPTFRGLLHLEHPPGLMHILEKLGRSGSALRLRLHRLFRSLSNLLQSRLHSHTRAKFMTNRRALSFMANRGEHFRLCKGTKDESARHALARGG